jgi:hypothetical protein
MKKYKYFYLKDEKEEVCGVLYAENINEAFSIASRMKQLELKSFKEIFGVKLL